MLLRKEGVGGATSEKTIDCETGISFSRIPNIDTDNAHGDSDTNVEELLFGTPEQKENSMQRLLDV
jgi:hypothetical protein